MIQVGSSGPMSRPKWHCFGFASVVVESVSFTLWVLVLEKIGVANPSLQLSSFPDIWAHMCIVSWQILCQSASAGLISQDRLLLTVQSYEPFCKKHRHDWFLDRRTSWIPVAVTMGLVYYGVI